MYVCIDESVRKSRNCHNPSLLVLVITSISCIFFRHNNNRYYKKYFTNGAYNSQSLKVLTSFLGTLDDSISLLNILMLTPLTRLLSASRAFEVTNWRIKIAVRTYRVEDPKRDEAKRKKEMRKGMRTSYRDRILSTRSLRDPEKGSRR